MRIRDIRWNDWHIEHIARHGVEPDEVEEITYGHSFYARRIGKERFLVVGQTTAGRYLSVILDREEPGIFFMVTARDAAPNERRLYDRHRGRR